MSLGTDCAYRFDMERCMLLETVPASIPIEFLIDRSPEHVEMVLDGFRPHIVRISGNGDYDDLRGEHYLSIGRNQLARTAQLVALCASYGCKLLVLCTCESARLGDWRGDTLGASPSLRNSTNCQSRYWAVCLPFTFAGIF
jgi:hypothetical protein